MRVLVATIILYSSISHSPRSVILNNVNSKLRNCFYYSKRHDNGTPANTKTSLSIKTIFITGYITLEEFKDACDLLGEHLEYPQEQALNFCKAMDINKDGLVDLNEFLETFRLVDMEKNQASQEDADTDEEMERIPLD